MDPFGRVLLRVPGPVVLQVYRALRVIWFPGPRGVVPQVVPGRVPGPSIIGVLLGPLEGAIRTPFTSERGSETHLILATRARACYNHL